MSNLEIRLFVGTAAARDGNKSRYPAGERHAFILFLSQTAGGEPDWERAEETILAEHWGDIELTRTGIASQEKQRDYPFSELYPHSLERGSALLIYSGVEGKKSITKPSTATAFPLRLRLHYKAARVGCVITHMSLIE